MRWGVGKVNVGKRWGTMCVGNVGVGKSNFPNALGALGVRMSNFPTRWRWEKSLRWPTVPTLILCAILDNVLQN